ncbi:MAG: hypothetical protein KAS72_15765 [Phycisphaerales bacterium]|nr:hypothetical protein [Phycisphaerales bacterium]
MRRKIRYSIVTMVTLCGAAAVQAQPLDFTYAGLSSDQGIAVYADALMQFSAIDTSTSLVSLTIFDVRSDYTGGDDNLFMSGMGMLGPDGAIFQGSRIYDSFTNIDRLDLNFDVPTGMSGNMIDLDGNEIPIGDIFSAGFSLAYDGEHGGDGIFETQSVTFEYEVTGVSFTSLSDFYGDITGIFALGRFQGIGVNGGDSAKVPGQPDPPQSLAPLPGTTGLAFVGVMSVAVASRRRR